MEPNKKPDIDQNVDTKIPYMKTKYIIIISSKNTGNVKCADDDIVACIPSISLVNS